MALFTEFPGNPLLRSPDLERIRQLADKYDFCVVVDETIGNFINVNVLPYADVVVSSLTKVFSGDSNVMGGGYVIIASQRSRFQLLTAIPASSSTLKAKTMSY
jgi:cystathionine gamma-synthase